MKELFNFAESIGITVKVFPFVSNAKGLMKGLPDGTLKIGIRQGMTDDEIAYTLAHELAHCYLHMDKGNTITSPFHKEYEEQADRAAKMLLDFISINKNAAVADQSTCEV